MGWTNEGRQTLLELVNRRFNIARDPNGNWVVTYGRLGLEHQAICVQGPDLVTVGQDAMKLLDNWTRNR
jgi:hypothetical protein